MYRPTAWWSDFAANGCTHKTVVKARNSVLAGSMVRLMIIASPARSSEP